MTTRLRPSRAGPEEAHRARAPASRSFIPSSCLSPLVCHVSARSADPGRGRAPAACSRMLILSMLTSTPPSVLRSSNHEGRFRAYTQAAPPFVDSLHAHHPKHHGLLSHRHLLCGRPWPLAGHLVGDARSHHVSVCRRHCGRTPERLSASASMRAPCSSPLASLYEPALLLPRASRPADPMAWATWMDRVEPRVTPRLHDHTHTATASDRPSHPSRPCFPMGDLIFNRSTPSIQPCCRAARSLAKATLIPPLTRPRPSSALRCWLLCTQIEWHHRRF